MSAGDVDAALAASAGIDVACEVAGRLDIDTTGAPKRKNFAAITRIP